MKRIRSKKKYVFVAVFCLIIIILGFIVAYLTNMRQMENKYKEEIVTLNKEISNNKKVVFVAKKEIQPGDIIQEKNVMEKEVFVSQKEGYITKKEFGRIAMVNIPKQQPILETMLQSGKDKTIREEEFSCLKLNQNLQKNDLVDIRILLPNGENKIVLSKKGIKKLDKENNSCFLWLNEEEIQKMSGAIVDSYLHDGTVLYPTRYIEREQANSIPTYEPSEAIMINILNDPNIVEKAKISLNLKARKELEQRLKEFEKGNKAKEKTSEEAVEETEKSVSNTEEIAYDD